MKTGPLLFALALSTLGCRTTTATAPLPWLKLPTVEYKGKQDDIFFLNPSLGWYVNGKGKIYKTVDGGNTWVEKLSQPGTYFRSVGFLDALHGFAGNIGPDSFPGALDETPLYETRDGGDTWKPVAGFPMPKGSGVCAIDILDEAFINAGVLDHRKLVHVAGRVDGPAYLVRSMDGGEHWRLIDLKADTAMVLDVKFFDANHGFLVGATDAQIERSHALVLRTSDGGRSWQRVFESTHPFEIGWKASFPTREVGYVTVMNYNPAAAKMMRVVGKTEDGGNTWRELPLVSDPAQQEFGVGFASPEHGWVGMLQGGFETQNGGKSWTHVDMGHAVNKIRIVRTPDGFVAFAIGSSVYRLDARTGAPTGLSGQRP